MFSKKFKMIYHFNPPRPPCPARRKARNSKSILEAKIISLPLATDTPPLPMEYPYFPDHNVSPTIVIMKENIEEGGGTVAKARDIKICTYFQWIMYSQVFRR